MNMLFFSNESGVVISIADYHDSVILASSISLWLNVNIVIFLLYKTFYIAIVICCSQSDRSVNLKQAEH